MYTRSIRWQTDFFIEHYKQLNQFSYLSHRTSFILNAVAATTVFAIFKEKVSFDGLKICIILFIIDAILSLFSSGLAFIFQNCEHRRIIKLFSENNFDIQKAMPCNILTNSICAIIIILSYISFLIGVIFFYIKN